MSRALMYPTDLARILYRAGGDSRLVCEAVSHGMDSDDKHPDGCVRYGTGSRPSVFIARCSRNFMAREPREEPDPWFEGRVWERQGWRRLLRDVCLNGNIPVPLRMRLHEIAERNGFTGFLTGREYWMMVL